MTTTLKTAIETYLAEINSSGKAKSTKYTFGNCLGIMQTHFGGDKEVGKILPVHMAGYFKSEAVTMMKSKDGTKPRATATVLQIRRIARQFLVWAVDQKLLDKLPLPKDEAEIANRKARAQEKKNAPNEPKVKKEKKATPSKWVAEPDKPKVEDDGEFTKEWIIGAPKDETAPVAEPADQPAGEEA